MTIYYNNVVIDIHHRQIYLLTKQMKSSHTIVRDKIFKDHHFYQAKQQTKPVSTEQYQNSQHQKVSNEYQSKKKPQFSEHQYSSSWNPLNKKYERVDRPYKELYERKHRVQKCSDMKSDPFAVIPSKIQSRHTLTHNRPQFKPSLTYKVEHERRYMLPKDREIAKANKNYHSQLGISQQRLPVFNRKQRERNMRNNSSLVRLTMDYSISGTYEALNRSVEGLSGYY